MDRRMACLGRVISETDALIDLLTEADGELVARAIRALDQLPRLDSCSRLRIEDTGALPPDDPVKRQAIEELQPQVARLHALHDAGRYAVGLEEGIAVVERAKQVGWRPIEAEAGLALAQLQLNGGKAQLAEATYEEAARAAEAGGVPHLIVRARIGLVQAVGDKLGRFDDGLERAKDAQAALEGLGHPDDELAAELARARGEMLVRHGKHGEGIEHLSRALELLRAADPQRKDARVSAALNGIGNAYADLGKHTEALAHYDQANAINRELFGERHPAIAADLSGRAGVLWAEDRRSEALALMEQAVDIATESLGPGHPGVGAYLNNLGVVYEHSGKLQKAAETYQSALANYEHTVEPDHPVIPNILTNLGNVLRELGQEDRALELHRRAAGHWKQSLGTEHFKYSKALNNLGNTLRDLERYEEALAAYEESLAIRVRAYEGEHSDIGQSLERIADVHHLRGNLKLAEKHYERALAMRRKVHGEDHLRTAWALIGLGRVLTEQGRTREAIPILELSLRIRERAKEPRTGDLAWPRFYLAQALWKAKRDRNRARQLASQALTELQAADRTDDEGLREVRAWVGAHRG
jgi:tetratricopeptide (TPR) repeat protein